MSDDPLRLDLGIVAVQTTPTEAYTGPHNRVHPTKAAALIDRATDELARLWLKECGCGAPSFAQIMGYVDSMPALFEAALVLARFKASVR